MYKELQHGFTLIELSIVLVIIGLIVGGVLVGQELIHSAELQTIITDENKYITAVNTFRLKYDGLPGDITNATGFWGTDPAGCPNLGPWTTASQRATCNGDGDGLIESWGVGGNTSPAFENYRAWQQLSDAGLIQGSYSGTPGPAGAIDAEPGVNVPAARMSITGEYEWMVFNASSSKPTSAWLNVQYQTQYLLLSNNCWQGTICHETAGYMLGGQDGYRIDKKVDDGLPGTGSVLGMDWWQYPSYAPGGIACDNATHTAYAINVPQPVCTLLFRPGL